jgi:hypothetical protein
VEPKLGTVLKEFAVSHGRALTDFTVVPSHIPPPETAEYPIAVKPIVVNNDHGGLLLEYMARWSKVAAKGGQVEVLGLCLSACTILTAYIPKDRLCFGKDGALGFHMARRGRSLDDSSPDPSPETTERMIELYPATDIRKRIMDYGGVKGMPTIGWWTLPASELWKMGYRKCKNWYENSSTQTVSQLEPKLGKNVDKLWVERCRNRKTDAVNLGDFAKYYGGFSYEEVDKICWRLAEESDR